MYSIRQILILLFIFATGYLIAQDEGSTIQIKIDKLESKLQDVSEKEKAEYLLKLSELYWRINPQKSIAYGKQAIEIYNTIDKKQLPNALINTAIGFFYNSQKDSTIYYVNQILNRYSPLLSDHHYGVCYNLLGVAYRYKGDYDKALENGEKSIKYFKKIKDTVRLAGAMDNISTIYETLGNYKKSLDYSLQSLMLFESKKDSSEIASTKINISNLYAYMKKYRLAKNYLNEAAKIFHAQNNSYDLANLYNNYGSTYMETKNYDSAYYMFKLAQKLFRKTKSRDGEAVVLQNIGLLQSYRKNYSAAIQNLQTAADMFKQADRNNDLADVYADLGEVYMQTDRPVESEKYLKKAELLAKKINNNRIRAKVYQLFYRLYEKTGNYKPAFEYHKKYTDLKDSIESKEVKTHIAGLEMQYQNVKKQKEIEHLQSQKKIQEIQNRNLLLVSLGLITLILLGGFFIYQHRKKEITINRLNREKSLLKEKQLTLDLEHSRKRLAAQILNIIHRNNLLKNYLQVLEDINSSDEKSVVHQVQMLKKDMQKTLKAKKDWDNFEEYFIKSDPGFIDQLKTEYPKLTNQEIRLASLIRIGMTNREISSVLNVNIQSIKNSLYRMKKKLQLDADISLREFLSSL